MKPNWRVRRDPGTGVRAEQTDVIIVRLLERAQVFALSALNREAPGEEQRHQQPGSPRAH